MINVKSYLQKLNSKDRAMLGLGFVILSAYLLYLIISSFNNVVMNKEAKLISNEKTLAWLKSVKNNIKTSQKITPKNHLAIIDTEINNSKLKGFPYQLQQTSSNEIRLSFRKVPFNEFMNWLWDTSKKYDLNISQFQGKKAKEAGIITLTVTIST